jgi:hypothetical protein
VGRLRGYSLIAVLIVSAHCTALGIAVPDQSQTAHTLSVATKGTLRVVLKARRAPGPDAATVVVAAFVKEGNRWEPAGAAVVARAGAFSWSSLLRHDGLRLLSLSEKERSVSFQLRISSAVGWSNTYVYAVRGGRLTGGVETCGCAPQN